MSFSVVGALALAPVLAAPWFTHRLFLDVEAAERTTIAVDNAAIVLGRRTRRIFDGLRTVEKHLRRLEGAHHAVHSCPEVRCRAIDAGLEATLKSVYGAAQRAGEIAWQAAGIAAQEGAAALNEAVTVARAPALPVRARRCRVCALAIGWALREAPVRASVRASVRARAIPSAGATVEVFEGEAGWQYRLAAVPAGGEQWE